MRRSTKRFWAGAMAGAAAALTMAIAMLVIVFIGTPVLTEPAPLSIITGILVRALGLGGVPAWAIALAFVVHLAYGALWGGLLAVSTPRVTVGKGLVIGLGLWLGMLVFWLPMSGNVTFAIATSYAMWIGTLVCHLIYGATLGWLVDRHPVPIEASLPAG
jgi:hypothetical protein